ncbi:hypothetical protein IFM89_020620 [Coptis chinensis]|uniref:Uncharacterized protein n=1 Tax=Coptis chinensis TaxID=261450 RepID=A0A835IC16_9MAGN|nr:hypothetical protein IFM89_020620 [Coptis chinensis]
MTHRRQVFQWFCKLPSIPWRKMKVCMLGDAQHVEENGLDTKVKKSRTQLKERKNRAKKVRGVLLLGMLPRRSKANDQDVSMAPVFV